MTDKEFFNSLPRKRMWAGVFFFDRSGRVLLVKPTYKSLWNLPGGTLDINESPKAAAQREVHEELGLRISKLQPLTINYLSKAGDVTEAVHVIFSGGILSVRDRALIKLPKDELSEFRFFAKNQALGMLREAVRREARHAFSAARRKQTLYLEDGDLL